MKISVIREFLHLCETKNFTRTAEDLYISQSVLSRHISSLEEELQTQLINRSRTAFELTAAGETAKESFEKILREYQELISTLSGMNGNVTGELHLGVLYYDYFAYVERIREVFLSHYPGIQLHLHSYQPEQIEQDLLNRKIDAAFLYSTEHSRHEDISQFPFLKIPFSIMFDASHPLSSKNDITIKDLDHQSILWPSSHLELSETAKILSDIFKENDVSMNEYISFSNFDDVPFLLKDRKAVFVSPMANPNAYHSSVICRHLQPDDYSVYVSTVWRKDSSNPVIRSLLNAVKICYP